MSRSFRHADIYQMIAYCTAADLPSGLLIYATGADEPSEYRINHARKTIEVTALDPSRRAGTHPEWRRPIGRSCPCSR